MVGSARVDWLDRGLRVLSLFDERSQGLRLHEIVTRTGIPATAVFRILVTMQEEGFVERDDRGMTWPTEAVLRLATAALVTSPLAALSEGPLRQLSRDTGKVVKLGVVHEADVLYLVRVGEATHVTTTHGVGSALPLLATAAGMTLLAHATPDLRSRVLSSHNASAHPPAIDSGAVVACLESVRRQQYALVRSDSVPEFWSLAVPLHTRLEQPVAAIEIEGSGAADPTDGAPHQLLPCLRTAADVIVASLERGSTQILVDAVDGDSLPADRVG